MKRSDVTMFDYIWTLGRLTAYLGMIQGIEKAGDASANANPSASRATTRFRL